MHFGNHLTAYHTKKQLPSQPTIQLSSAQKTKSFCIDKLFLGWILNSYFKTTLIKKYTSFFYINCGNIETTFSLSLLPLVEILNNESPHNMNMFDFSLNRVYATHLDYCDTCYVLILLPIHL